MLRLFIMASYLVISLSVSVAFVVPIVLALDLLGLKPWAEAISNFVVRTWARYAVIGAGGSVRVHGIEKLPRGGNICVIANHQEYSDIVLLLGWLGRPLGFVAKEELGKVPLLSTWMRLIHSLFIDRRSLRQGVQVIYRAARRLRSGYSLVIFPEGTRSRGAAVADFKPGSFKAAKLAGSRILPVSIDGSWRFLEKPWRVSPCRVDLTIHDTIDAASLGASEWKDLPQTIRGTISSEIRQYREGILPPA